MDATHPRGTDAAARSTAAPLPSPAAAAAVNLAWRRTLAFLAVEPECPASKLPSRNSGPKAPGAGV